MPMKSYGQQCAVALALDQIGDRWTLLIVRELMVTGGSRYSDLQAGLPGIATNLLSTRLKDMEANSLIVREEMPPPVATTLIRLTERGQALAPVLATLGAWGMQLLKPRQDGKPFRSRNLRLPLQLFLVAPSSAAAPIALVLRMGDEPLTVHITPTGTHVNLGASANADLTLAGPAPIIFRLLLKRMGAEEAMAAGVKVEGDVAILDRLATRWLGD